MSRNADAVAGEDLVEVGEVGEFCGAGVSDSDFRLLIVADEGASVGGAAHVELGTRRNHGRGRGRRMRRFSGMVRVAGAAVAEQEMSGFSGGTRHYEPFVASE
jgi:hypothetical protein